MSKFIATPALVICLAFFAQNLPAASGQSSWTEGAVQAMDEAASELREAARDFTQSAPNSGQRTGATTYSGQATTAPAPAQPSAPAPAKDPAAEALHGSPATGYAGTWTDPATGDIITSVIAPEPQTNTTHNYYPMIIEPQVSGDWSNAYSSGWQSGWPQWPVAPGSPGYGQQFNPPVYPGANPPPHPGWRPYPPNSWQQPGQHYPGAPWPGQQYPGGMNPPYPNHPFNPAYRPLKPYPPAQNPGAPGTNPAFPPNNPGNAFPPSYPGFNPPPAQNPGIWQPGMTPPASGVPPQNMPNNPPGWKPLPMRPGGQTWTNPGWSQPSQTPGFMPRGRN